MFDSPAPLVFGLLALGMVAWLVSMRRARRHWQDFAGRWGWSFHDLRQPQLRGARHGVQACVDLEHRGRGRNRRIVTVVTAEVGAPLPEGLRLVEENLLHGIAKLFGAQDVTVGRDDLDDALVIKALDEAAAARLLRRSSVALPLLALVKAQGASSVEHGRVKLVLHGWVTDEERLRDAVDRACLAAAALREGARA